MALFDLVAVLLALAAAFGCLNHLLLHLPRSIGVLLLSLALAACIIVAGPLVGFGFGPWLRLGLQHADLPHVLLDGMLAFLLFAGTLHVDFAQLRANTWVILLLATFSVVLATVLFGFGLYGVSRLLGVALPLRWCAVLGAALAPTDAVVVDGLLRRMRLPPVLRAAISGESLFNDGAGVVMFVVALGIAQGGTALYGHGEVALALLIEGGGGIAVGLATGYVAGLLMRRVDDDALRLMTTLALVLGAYRIAGALLVSGPIAVVAGGLVLCRMIPGLGHGGEQRTPVTVFWSMLDELLDLMLFLLIGMQTLDLTFSRAQVLLALAAIPLALLVRFVSVLVPAALAFPRALLLPGSALLTWAGLRGGISVALALTLPATPYSGMLLGICYAVVVFSIIAQGLTMTRVLTLLFD